MPDKNIARYHFECSDFFKHAGAGILTWQENFPAFFVKPKNAELGHEEFNAYDTAPKRYKGPARFAYDRCDGRASLRAGNLLGDQLTLEPRLAIHAPYLPVYLTLAAMRHGIVTEGQKLDKQEQHPMASFTNRRCLQDARYNHNVGEDCPTIRRGKGGYLNMIEQTAASLQRADAIPAVLGTFLLRSVIEDYKAYLETPNPHVNYTSGELSDMQSHLQQIESSSQIAERPEAHAHASGVMLSL